MNLLIASTKQRLPDYIKFAEALRPLGVETICVHDVNYYALSESKVLNHVPFPKLLKLIKRFNPDFIITNSPYYTVYIAKLVNQRLLVHLRGDMWTESYWYKTLYPSLFKRTWYQWKTFVMTRGIKKADLILPICKWLEEKVRQHLSNYPTQVLYRGIDSKKWNPNTYTRSFKLEHPAVVGVFDLEIYQKVTGLLKFIKGIKKMPDINFYFAGNGPYANLVKQKRPSNMFLIGRIPKPDIQSLLASGDIFVHPSGLDAVPRSIAEASLMEKPIIASNVGGIPEIVKDNKTGYLCNINDPDQWVEKTRFLLDNPSVARKLGKDARKFVTDNFSWKKIAEGFVRGLVTKTELIG